MLGYVVFLCAGKRKQVAMSLTQHVFWFPGASSPAPPWKGLYREVKFWGTHTSGNLFILASYSLIAYLGTIFLIGNFVFLQNFNRYTTIFVIVLSECLYSDIRPSGLVLLFSLLFNIFAILFYSLKWLFSCSLPDFIWFSLTSGF